MKVECPWDMGSERCQGSGGPKEVTSQMDGKKAATFILGHSLIASGKDSGLRLATRRREAVNLFSRWLVPVPVTVVCVVSIPVILPTCSGTRCIVARLSGCRVTWLLGCHISRILGRGGIGCSGITTRCGDDIYCRRSHGVATVCETSSLGNWRIHHERCGQSRTDNHEHWCHRKLH